MLYASTPQRELFRQSGIQERLGRTSISADSYLEPWMDNFNHPLISLAGGHILYHRSCRPVSHDKK